MGSLSADTAAHAPAGLKPALALGRRGEPLELRRFLLHGPDKDRFLRGLVDLRAAHVAELHGLLGG